MRLDKIAIGENAPEDINVIIEVPVGDMPSVDRILVDLGLSSDQLADRDRGFGFRIGGDLDLRPGIEGFRVLAEGEGEVWFAGAPANAAGREVLM